MTLHTTYSYFYFLKSRRHFMSEPEPKVIFHSV